MKIKNQEGFTLVELMVVVAIIGTLSAVAIPNFKKYQAKAKTSEAKLALAAIYSAEVAYHGDADRYGTCLADMGYDPTGTAAERYYSVGFASAHAFGGTFNGVICTAAASTGQSIFLGTKGGNDATEGHMNSGLPTVTSFTAGAVGTVDRGSPRESMFTMTESKTLLQTSVGY